MTLTLTLTSYCTCLKEKAQKEALTRKQQKNQTKQKVLEDDTKPTELLQRPRDYVVKFTFPNPPPLNPPILGIYGEYFMCCCSRINYDDNWRDYVVKFTFPNPFFEFAYSWCRCWVFSFSVTFSVYLTAVLLTGVYKLYLLLFILQVNFISNLQLLAW